MLLGVVIDDRGLVPDADVKRLNEFGKTLSEAYSKSLGSTKGKGKEFIITLPSSQQVSSVVIMEDISKGERIREYQLVGKRNGEWHHITKGSSVGHKRIELVDGVFEAIQLKVISSEGEPFIRNFACY